MKRGDRLDAASRGAACAATVIALLACAGRAAADSGADDRVLATALFKEARALLAEGRVAEACPKLEESHRLDPSGGTILNLALCHEQEGKLARSWAEFNEAVAFARRDHRGDREVEAGAHASSLEARLSRLTVVVPENVRLAGLQVERDGRELGRASWSLAMPVDGGEHSVRATAPGHEPFIATISVPDEGGAATVEIPALTAAPPPPPAPRLMEASTAPAAASLVAAPAPPPDHQLRRTAAWIVGAAGAAQLAVAAYFGIQAYRLKSRNDPSDGKAADWSTRLAITGLATTGVGVYLFLTSRPEPAPTPTQTVVLAPHGLALGFSAPF